MGMIVKKEVYTHRWLETGGSASHAASHGRILRSVRRQERGKGPEPSLRFSLEEIGRCRIGTLSKLRTR